MSNAVGNPDPLARLRAADPVEIEDLERRVAPRRSRVMERAIALGEAGVDGAASRRSGLLTRRRGLSLGFGSLACAAILAAVIVFSGGSVESVRQGAQPGFADAAVRVAEANPRFLVTAPGWRAVEAKSFRPKVGTLVFGDGRHRVRLYWLPASYYRELFESPRPSTRTLPPSTVLGRKVVNQVFVGPAGLKDFSTYFPPEGGIAVAVEGVFANRAGWEAVLASLRSVGVDRWLGAMPAAVVSPSAISTELTRMLRGVAIPPGFDATAAVDRNELTNRFQAAKHVTQSVTCGWVDRWISARRGGDAGGAREAVDALAGARRWPVLLRMAREKGYRGTALPTAGYGWSASILTIGRRMAAGELRRGGPVYNSTPDGLAKVGFGIPRGVSPPNTLTCPASK